MESGGTEHQIRPFANGKTWQVDLDERDSIAKRRAEIRASGQQHVPRSVDRDHSPTRKSFEQLTRQPTGPAPGIDRLLVTTHLETIEHPAAPFRLRGRDTMVGVSIPFSWYRHVK